MTNLRPSIAFLFKPMPVMLLFLAFVVGGCHVPARIFWSPDGSRAVYINYGQIAVIDAEGQIQFQALGDGTAVWSDDGQTAYFALSTDAVPDAPVEPTVYQTRWADDAVAPPREPPEQMQVIVAYGADGVQPLCVLDQALMHLDLSPDGNWLAMMTAVPDGNGAMSLFAWHLPTQTLHLIERTCGFAAAFTGDSRLAYAMPHDPNQPAANQPSKLIEVTLDVTRDQLERRTLLNVRGGMTAWIQPLGDDILLSVAWHGEDEFDPNVHPIRIVRFSRGEEAPHVVADWTGGLFAISPDGRSILFERVTPRKGVLPKVELMIMEIGQDKPRLLRDVTQQIATQPMWPNWRGNDQIAYTPAPAEADPVDPIDEQWRRTEVMLYELTDDEETPLRAVKTLSTNWETELKPRYRVGED